MFLLDIFRKPCCFFFLFHTNYFPQIVPYGKRVPTLKYIGLNHWELKTMLENTQCTITECDMDF